MELDGQYRKLPNRGQQLTVTPGTHRRAPEKLPALRLGCGTLNDDNGRSAALSCRPDRGPWSDCFREMPLAPGMTIMGAKLP